MYADISHCKRHKLEIKNKWFDKVEKEFSLEKCHKQVDVQWNGEKERRNNEESFAGGFICQ